MDIVISLFGGMIEMKKIIALGLAACLAVTCFVSCDDTPPVETTESYVK